MNLLQRLNAVRKDVKYIQKDKSVSTGASGSYKAVTHDMVTAMTRELLIQNGVIFFPSMVASKMSPPVKADGKQWLYEATYDFEFCNVDEPKDTKTVRIEAHANDNADKAPGKALSYATKYAILKVLNIETGEDEESRVKDEFDLAPHIMAMESAKSLDDLKAAFEAADKAAKEAKEHGAVKVILTKKNDLVKVFMKSIPRPDGEFNKAVEAIKAGTYSIAQLKERALTEKQQHIVADLEAVTA